MGYANAELLVEPAWLQAHADDPDLVLVDCPWEYYSYTRAHIPGALCRPGHPYVKGKDAAGERSAHLPGPAAVQEMAAALGIGPDTTVVLYDDWGGTFAGRLWWVLRYYGHERAKILNGGWQAWVTAGLPVAYTIPKATPPDATFTPTPHPERLATMAQLLAHYDTPAWQVLDARSAGEYSGEGGKENKRRGHVPGAIHVEWNRLLEHSSDDEAVRRFRPADEMEAILEEAGIHRETPIVTYCQAAARAAFVAFALELLGYPTPRVYDGSMAEWANIADTPLEP